MSLTCHSCANELSGAHIACQGFCNAVFHLKCSGVASGSIDDVMKNQQLFWMCKSCTKLMLDVRHRKTVSAAYDVGIQHALSANIVELKNEILTELKAELKASISAFFNPRSITPKTAKRPRREGTYPIARRLFSQKRGDPELAQQLMLATGQSSSPSLAVTTVPPIKPKFWLYLSRISRDVSVEQIKALAQQRLATTELEVVRLVARDRDVNTLAFISFKIGMDSDLKMSALDPTTWPNGILFREFKQNSRAVANFWRPDPIQNHHSAGMVTDPLLDELSPEQVLVVE